MPNPVRLVPNQSQTETTGKRPNRRAESKALTRQKVQESARRLFMERGYEGATMRDIAADAGLSTGALFANFADKADLFNEVIVADFRLQFERMREAVASQNLVKDKIVALCGAGYRFHLSQLPLLQAGISVSWSQGLKGELGERSAWRAVINFFVEIFNEGVARGELVPDFDRELAAEIIWDCYLANYRHAMFGDWGFDELNERLAAQVDLLLRAVRVRH